MVNYDYVIATLEVALMYVEDKQHFDMDENREQIMSAIDVLNALSTDL